MSDFEQKETSTQTPVEKWLLDVEYVQEVERNKYVKCMVYGASGVGKTHFAGTSPSPLFIDSDKGLKTIHTMGLNAPYIPLARGERVYRKVLEVISSAAKKDSPFWKEKSIQTIVFDSYTSLADMLMVEIMKFPSRPENRRDPDNDKPIFDHWTALQARLKNLTKQCQDLGFNIIATCGQQVDKDEVTGAFMGQPAIQGGYRNTIMHDFDEVYYMTAETKNDRTEYKLYTKPYRYWVAKSRGNPPAIVVNPEFEQLFGG